MGWLEGQEEEDRRKTITCSLIFLIVVNKLGGEKEECISN
jgi:hypothetical protein